METNTQHIFYTSKPQVSATSMYPSSGCTRNYKKEVIYLNTVTMPYLKKVTKSVKHNSLL